MLANNIEISIVIVSMNHLGKLQNLLRSLYGEGKTEFSFEIILIDNCSKDNTIRFVRSNYPKVRIHRNKDIKGFGANNNYGFYLAKGEYIFICNPDIIVLPNAINNLFRFYKTYPHIGILCPQLLNTDKSYQASVRKFHTFKILVTRLLTKAKDTSTNKIIRNYLMIDLDRDKIQPIDWALGAAMFMHRNVYKKLCGFDERFFLYVEDVDLCLRAWLSGLPVIYNPQSVMIHDHQRRSSRIINKYFFYHCRSMMYFLYKHWTLLNQLSENSFRQNSYISFSSDTEMIQHLTSSPAINSGSPLSYIDD